MMAQANYSTGATVMTIDMHDCSIVLVTLYSGEHKTLCLGRKPASEQEHEKFEARNILANASGLMVEPIGHGSKRHAFNMLLSWLHHVLAARIFRPTLHPERLQDLKGCSLREHFRPAG